MSISRPFAYNPIPPNSLISGTDQVGDIAIGVDPTLSYTNNAGGVQWWMGPDEELGYIITQSVPSLNQPNPLGIPAGVGFYRSQLLTEASFISISNYVTGQSFASGDAASTYLTSNGFWNSWVPSLVTQTPTPTITQTPTITPTITPTPTSATPLLLDAYPNAYYAWSIARRLRTTYTNSLIRIRRSNDNAETDIGYNGSNELDTAAITSFVGANSAFITTKYDQSGNGRNFTQTTAAKQPRIVNAGTLEVENGKPTSRYLSDTTMSLTGLPTPMPSSAMMYYVIKLTKTANQIMHNGSGNNSAGSWLDFFGNGVTSPGAGQNSGTLSWYKNGSILISVNADVLYDNFINTNALMSIKNINMAIVGWTGSIFDGYGSPSLNFGGSFQEDVFYGTQSNSQTGIENNIKTYYSL